MKPTLVFIFVLFFQISFGQSIIGKWKTIDDETGKEKGVVEIYENKGKIYGKIIEIFDATKRHLKCEKCTGEDNNKTILGMNIIKGLTKKDGVWDDGKIV